MSMCRKLVLNTCFQTNPEYEIGGLVQYGTVIIPTIAHEPFRQDRKFSYLCCTGTPEMAHSCSSENCYTTGYINNWDARMDYYGTRLTMQYM